MLEIRIAKKTMDNARATGIQSGEKTHVQEIANTLQSLRMIKIINNKLGRAMLTFKMEFLLPISNLVMRDQIFMLRYAFALENEFSHLIFK